jgi:hypothetical protein
MSSIGRSSGSGRTVCQGSQIVRVRSIVTVATVIAAGTVLGGGLAVAAPHRPATPGVYQSWGPSWVTSDGWNEGVGKGVFGERQDATAVGGTQSYIALRDNGRGVYVTATYYFYGPGPNSTTCGSQGGSCWYVKDSDRFPNSRAPQWVSAYGSTGLVGNAERARGYFKVCEDHRFASDPCSATSILTTSY